MSRTACSGQNVQDAACAAQLDLCRSSIARSSIAYVPTNEAPIPAMANALLVTSLKNGTAYVATDSDGLAGPQSGSHTGLLANPGAILAFTPAVAAGP